MPPHTHLQRLWCAAGGGQIVLTAISSSMDVTALTWSSPALVYAMGPALSWGQKAPSQLDQWKEKKQEENGHLEGWDEREFSSQGVFSVLCLPTINFSLWSSYDEYYPLGLTSWSPALWSPVPQIRIELFLVVEEMKRGSLNISAPVRGWVCSCHPLKHCLQCALNLLAEETGSWGEVVVRIVVMFWRSLFFIFLKLWQMSPGLGHCRKRKWKGKTWRRKKYCFVKKAKKYTKKKILICISFARQFGCWKMPPCCPLCKLFRRKGGELGCFNMSLLLHEIRCWKLAPEQHLSFYWSKLSLCCRNSTGYRIPPGERWGQEAWL